MRNLILLLVVLLALSQARRSVFNRYAIPRSHRHVGRADGSTQLELVFALQQRNLDVLDAKFWEVSDPKSDKYGQFMSREDILDIIAPPKHLHDQVVAFLLTNGIASRSYGDAISFTITAEQAELVFHTEMHDFVDQNGDMITRQMGEYSLPTEVAHIVDFVSGLSEFPQPRFSASKKATTDSYVSPQTIASLYNIGDSTADSKSSQGVIEFQNDKSYSKKDLKKFYKLTDVTTSDVTHIVGPFSGMFPNVEASLDIQYITAVGINAENWYWTANNWMYDFAVNFFNTETLPMVVSMSWGWSEVGQCDITTTCSTLGIDAKTYVTRTNTEFQKIGLRGTTLISASGDSGANGRTDQTCNDSVLHPVYPGASPYVTSVGATQLTNPEFNLENFPSICDSYKCASGGTEVAVSYDLSGFTSGGGFSDFADRPSYQDDAIAGYLAQTESLPASSYFNSTGRGYPDVAALGHNFLCYISGEIEPAGGTSAAAPTFAGVVAILNSARLNNGQSAFGFINPFLYTMAKEHPAAFNDVVSGDNFCTEYGCASSCTGFKATTGWDAVTGLGTPNVAEMLSYISSQSKIVQ